MTVKRISRDIALLPQQLLPLAKAQLRIEYCDEDAVLVEMISRAIDQFQIYSQGVHVHPAVWEWRFADIDFCDGRTLCRFWPIVDMTVVDASDLDVTDSYEVVSNSLFGMPVNYLEGPAAAGTATIEVGFQSAEEIEPGIRAELMRLTAQGYEYREIMLPTNIAIDPLWQNQMNPSYWMPRV